MQCVVKCGDNSDLANTAKIWMFYSDKTRQISYLSA